VGELYFLPALSRHLAVGFGQCPGFAGHCQDFLDFLPIFTLFLLPFLSQAAVLYVVIEPILLCHETNTNT